MVLLFHNWRSIDFVLAATGALTFALMMLCYAESHQSGAQNRQFS
jgi:hypothetical protein